MLDNLAELRFQETVQDQYPGFTDTLNESLLNDAIGHAQNALLQLQHGDGYWAFELEADCAIPAEYILMMHSMGEVDEILQAKIAKFLRAHHNREGSYSLFIGGEGDISCTTRVYYALKCSGDKPNSPHMQKMREFILQSGGAARCNVFTRILLAMFEQIPWRGVPYMPVEIILLPRWFPFHLDKVSYWSRVVMVPLFILCSLKAKAQNPEQIDIQELFTVPAEEEKNYFPDRTPLSRFFLLLDRMGRLVDPLIPMRIHQHAINKARAWIIERLNGEDGLGGIFPAMVNSYKALDLLGYPEDSEHLRTCKKALQKHLVVREHDAYCQPCLSPIWDTGLAVLALHEANQINNDEPISKGIDWLLSKQLKDEPGDWQIARPNLEGGGWAFEFENPFYPDIDDSAVVAYALTQMEGPRFKEPISRAANWIAGMQSKNGGFGAFDADNTYYYLNHIPFADHGALLDPPTADVSARCAMFLAKLIPDHPQYHSTLKSCIEYLRNEQESNGSWFGRWGTNYIYGTWSVLVAMEEIGMSTNDPMIRSAVNWLKNTQRTDGGWGEDNYSYHDESQRGQNRFSTSFQTAWALLGLLAAGEVESLEVKSGIDFLLRTQNPDGFWKDDCFTAPGFPRVFYLKYHGYDKYFPLWALARHRNLISKK